jgi:hypothetical protein
VIRTLKQYVISDGETAPTLPAVPAGNQTILTAPRRQEGAGEAGTEADGSAREGNAEAADQAEGADGSAQAEAAELSPEGGEAAADAENGGEGNAQ